MPATKKIQGTLEPHAGQWRATAKDRSGLQATGLKPKHAKAALLGKLVEKYQCEVELELKEVYPPHIQAKLDELEAMTAQAEQLGVQIPKLRNELVREMYGLHMGQTEIAKKVSLSQGYVAQLLKAEEESLEGMIARPGKRV